MDNKTKGLIAIDFDGVIAKIGVNNKLDGTFPNCFDVISKLINNGYCVYIFTARRTKEVEDFLYQTATGGLKFEIIPNYYHFWDKKGTIGISNKKLPAILYIDDNAYRFKGDWKQTLSDIEGLI